LIQQFADKILKYSEILVIRFFLKQLIAERSTTAEKRQVIEEMLLALKRGDTSMYARERTCSTGSIIPIIQMDT
jgi:hypothetical protein